MVKKYKILKSTSYINLENSVSTHIKDGWEPIGGLSVDNNGECYQAIVKREE